MILKARSQQVMSVASKSWQYKHFLLPPMLVSARYAGADVLVQKYEMKSAQARFNWSRVKKYATFGFVQMFFVFNPLYTRIYPKIIPKLGRFPGLKVAMFDCVAMIPMGNRNK